MIEKYPDQLQVILTPYTADTKVVTDESGLWAAIKKHDVGWFGIKPFASNSLFKGDSSPDQPDVQGGQSPGPPGHSLRSLQPRDHCPDPGIDQCETGRQRGAGRQGTPGPGCGRADRAQGRHDSRLGRLAAGLPLAARLGVCLMTALARPMLVPIDAGHDIGRAGDFDMLFLSVNASRWFGAGAAFVLTSLVMLGVAAGRSQQAGDKSKDAPAGNAATSLQGGALEAAAARA